MAIVVMDSAGKVPIPSDIRDRLQLKPGDEVELRFTRDGRLLLDKANILRKLTLTGEPERSVIRPSRVQVRHEPPDDD